MMAEMKVRPLEPRIKEIKPIEQKQAEKKAESVEEPSLEERATQSEEAERVDPWLASASAAHRAPVLEATAEQSRLESSPRVVEPRREESSKEFSAYETMQRHDEARSYVSHEKESTLAPTLLAERGVPGTRNTDFINPDRRSGHDDRDQNYDHNAKSEDRIHVKRRMPWE